MLIFNIEGNNNYGEAFSDAVEKAFSELLTNYRIKARRGTNGAMESVS